MPRITFVVKGCPIGKARARTVKRGSFIHSYTPKKTVDYENMIISCFIDSHPDHKLIEDKPIKLHITALFDLPKSYPKKTHGELKEKLFMPCTKKPDWDNIGKTVSDALNMVAWKDDSLISQATVDKLYYADGAMLIVIISWED